ncbi:4a-hydroxytetrahydrobiopterin dehydratase [Oerskovia sp. M15]
MAAAGVLARRARTRDSGRGPPGRAIRTVPVRATPPRSSSHERRDHRPTVPRQRRRGDWRVLLGTAQTRFRTGSFTAGVELVDAIGELAEGMNHHPDVDLRYATVTVRLSSHDVGGLSARDVELARRISIAADELDLPAETTGLVEVEVAVDALDRPAVRPFWRAVLGYADGPAEDDGLGLGDPAGYGPPVWFQQMDAPRPQRNRIHLDVTVPHDQAESRVTAAIAAAATWSRTRVRRRSGSWRTSRATRPASARGSPATESLPSGVGVPEPAIRSAGAWSPTRQARVTTSVR